MTEEEIKAVQDENVRLKASEEAHKAEKAAKDIELEETRGKLSKLENKEFNFKKLREMTQEEKDKLTDFELGLKQKQEALEENQRTFTATTVSTWKSDALDKYSLGDPDLRKKLETAYEEFKGDAQDREAIFARALKAATLVQAPAVVSPVGTAMSSGGNAPSREVKNYAETPEGKDLASSLGLGIAKETK